MSGFQAPPLLGFDPATGLLALPWWAALVALLFVVALVAAMRGPAAAVVAGASRLALLIVVLWGAWTLSERLAEAERATERQSLEARARELQAAALAPGSALACLDAPAGQITEGCEQALFATPQSTAAAIALTSARVALLVDGARMAPRRDRGAEVVPAGLRRALELDPFGIVAHVLAAHYGCSSEKCEPLGLLRDASRVQTNLREATFDGILARHAATWAAHGTRPQGSASESTASAARAGPSPVPPGFNLPSADSIPPVSIMNPEPAPSQPSVRSFAPVEETPSGSPRRVPSGRTPSSRVQQADRPLQLTPAQ